MDGARSMGRHIISRLGSALLLGASALVFPSFALAAPMTFQSLAFQLTDLLNLGAMTLIVLGLVVYFWGVSINITHFGGDDKENKKHSFFIWGIIVLFVMVSVWGIVALLRNTVFGNSAFDPTTSDAATTYCDSFGDCDGIE